MSIKVMTAVWTNAPVGGSELLALLAIADWADDDGLAWPKLRQLAAKVRLDERSARRLVRKLEESGCLRVERSAGGPGRASRYWVHPNGDNLSPLQERLTGTPVTANGDTGDQLTGTNHAENAGYSITDPSYGSVREPSGVHIQEDEAEEDPELARWRIQDARASPAYLAARLAQVREERSTGAR